MNRDDWIQQQDIEQLEYEAIEALKAVSAAGLVAEAKLLASAAGLSTQWNKHQPKREAA